VLLTYTPLLFAIEKENGGMVHLLLSLGADPLVRGWTR
jgi:ankyrin repeat protein